MKLKTLLEGLALDLPSFDHYKEFLLKAHKEITMMGDDTLGKIELAKKKTQKLEDMLKKEHIYVDPDIEEKTRAYFDGTTGNIYIEALALKEIQLALITKNSGGINQAFMRLATRLSHEISHRNQAIKSRGKSIMSGATKKDFDVSKAKGNVKHLGQTLNDMSYLADPQEISAYATQLAFQLKHKHGFKTIKEVSDYIDEIIKNESGSGALVRDYKQFGYRNKEILDRVRDQTYTPKEAQLVSKIKNVVKYDKVYKSFLRKTIKAFQELSSSQSNN